MDEHLDRRLIAFSLGSTPPELVPAPRWRQWMNDTDHRWANRCLPLLVANEAGWALLNPSGFTATWKGGKSTDDLTLEWDSPEAPRSRLTGSHFGYGIVTWSIPYLFRTPPGYNLLARGPANWPKDGACALEGLVETDWSVATFTMNWKLTRPDHPVRFEENEPFCMVVPMRRGELKSFSPEIRDIRSEPELRRGVDSFTDSRDQISVKKFLARFSRDFEAEQLAWEQHYFRGRTPEGAAAPEHETQLSLAEFHKHTNDDQPSSTCPVETEKPPSHLKQNCPPPRG